jgi:AraC-like DNA-binding protein
MEQEFINKAKEFIEGHLKKDFSLADLTHFVGYSSYHFTREFKDAIGISVMEYVREQRVYASAKEIATGLGICEVAMDYCFDTHAGFTKAFISIVGCTPKQYSEHANKPNRKGDISMENSKIVIRPICRDDVQDLWENVYSAMTPRQITEIKILPSIEAYEKKEGIHLVAQVDGKVIMALPLLRLYSHPVGFLFDNNFVLTESSNDIIMEKMLEEMKRQAKMMGMTALEMWQQENSKNTEAFQHFGFTKVFTAGGRDYLMMSI